MTRALLRLLASETAKLEQAGLYKRELVFPAATESAHKSGGNEINFTSYDYLGLAVHPLVGEAAVRAIREHGHGLSASRPFCGTRSLHKELEHAIAQFLELPDAIVYGSGYLANLGLFDALFDGRDSIFCDSCVHPSLAEAARLSSAKAIPYRTNDIDDLEDKLKRSRAARFRAIVTDSVYPFSGEIAPLAEICDISDRYDALVVVDESLAVGVLGQAGRGARELRGVMKRVHIVTGTFSKVLGGAAGGYVAGSREVVEWLRQKSTPYLFSGGLPPAMAGAAHKAVDLVAAGQTPLGTLRQRQAALTAELTARGFTALGGEHPIVAVMVGDALRLQKTVDELARAGVHVHGLCYPVVPEREARVRIQVSALHSQGEIDRVSLALDKVGRALGII